MNWILAHLPKDWGRLPSLPSTNFKILVGARLAYLTLFFYFATELAGRHIDSVNFGLWLGFVAAWATISYAQFRTKRQTDSDYVAATSTTAIPVPLLEAKG